MTPIERGEALIASGQYAEALVQLHAARRSTDAASLVQRIELAIGTALLRRGEIERATPHVERALATAREHDELGAEVEALTHLGEIYQRRGELERAASAFNVARVELDRESRGDLRARCLIGQAALAHARSDRAAALSLAQQALDDPDRQHDSVACAALLVLAACHRDANDLDAAERASRESIRIAAAAQLPRELADCYVAYAHLVGDANGALDAIAMEPPAAMLARAQELLRVHGSLADLERVREAFRRFGRRATDRVPAHEMRTLLDGLRDARATVGREVHRIVDAIAVDGANPQLTELAHEADQAIASTMEAMSSAEARMLAATQAIISERENIRTLLELIRTLNQLGDYPRVLAESCRMAAQLTGADRGLVAIRNAAGMLEVRATFQMPDPSSETGWQRALDRVLETRGPLLVQAESVTNRSGEELRIGIALVTPLRHGDQIFGAIYVDKELCGGVFTSQELDLLAIFCAQAATMLQNVRASEELRLAARSRAATLEAISDGVLSLDCRGAITSINAIAARILAVAPNARPNLALFPDLSFLRATLERGEEVEARLTRVGAYEYVVNARVVRSDDLAIAGVVVTLTELKRVQSIAQQIVGSHARYSFADLIGQAPSLRQRLKLAEAAARSDSNVLVTGESGTGKELVAQAIHNASGRSGGPFVGINCSAIPRELLESELFGYEGGAFTGARRGGLPGKFELAEGGTILLDEIGDMPLEMQAKLLRVLQERRVRRIGGAREIKIDARVIATTHRDLDEAAARGQFRSDLLFRLKVIHISLPALRDRASDIPVLVDHFLQLFAARLGKQVSAVAPAVMAALQRYAWPGNIRELENVLESEVNLIEPDAQVLEHVPDALRRRRAVPSKSPSSAMTLEQAERELLVEALTRHAGSIPEAARALGVVRGTVYNLIRRHGVDPDQYRPKG
ncbi:MAG TPA: sigma 54-interacting transcriptional regulator [Kofleriaceae bacterium]